jgi:hypothetical protein
MSDPKKTERCLMTTPCPPELPPSLSLLEYVLLLCALLVAAGVAWAIWQARSGTRAGVVAGVAIAALGVFAARWIAHIPICSMPARVLLSPAPAQQVPHEP